MIIRIVRAGENLANLLITIHLGRNPRKGGSPPKEKRDE
jgi:hypothetical protein